MYVYVNNELTLSRGRWRQCWLEQSERARRGGAWSSGPKCPSATSPRSFDNSREQASAIGCLPHMGDTEFLQIR